MNEHNIKKLLYHDVPLKILSFVSVRHGALLSADEIRQSVKTSKGATNQTLRLLLDLDILSRQKKGNVFIYKLNTDNSLLKQFKIFENVMKLQDLIGKIRKYCNEIVLFGSCASGTNAEESDMDLFIRTEHKEEVMKILRREEADLKLKPVIHDSLEHAAFKNEDEVFYNQIMKGITLWKGKPEHEEV